MFERTAFIPDIHYPHHDEQALACALRFLSEFRPHRVFVLGDAVDFPQISRYVNDPERLAQLQQDIDGTHAVLARIRDAAPRAGIEFLEGNHERRMRKFLRSHAPALDSLRSLRLPELLRLRELRITYYASGVTSHRGFIVKHGTTVRARAGYTATAELERSGLSGISGHTHRLGQVYRRTNAARTTWVEAGCLCDLNPDYMEGAVADWHHGLAYGEFQKRGRRFEVRIAPIVNGSLLLNGREIRGKA